jgi:hypothetical protein
VIDLMVGAEGFEPPTLCFQIELSIFLSQSMECSAPMFMRVLSAFSLLSITAAFCLGSR